MWHLISWLHWWDEAGAAPPPAPEPAPSVTLAFRSTPRLFGPKRVATSP